MPTRTSRRRILRLAALAVPAALVSSPVLSAARTNTPRRLAFAHTHTGETLDVVYFENGRYDKGALAEINHLLRDFRSEDVHPIDKELLDFLSDAHTLTGSRKPFQVISGYRSPATNSMLLSKGAGVARRSQHLLGRAIDVRLADVETNLLRRAARDLGRGGVGFYPESDFVHLDTGRVRFW